jgi:hypothetical protein
MQNVQDLYSTVVYLPHARTVEPQEQHVHQQWNNGIMQPASRHWLSKYTSTHAQWRHAPTVLSYCVTCFLCGLHYATVEVCFLCCLCRGYITWVRSRLGKSQIWDSEMWSWVLWDSDLRMNMLARASSNCKGQTHPLVRNWLAVNRQS